MHESLKRDNKKEIDERKKSCKIIKENIWDILLGKQTNFPNDDYLLRMVAESQFFKGTSSCIHSFILLNFKTSFRNIFIKSNYLK